MAQRQRALIDQIEQTARRRHQNVATRHQRAGLLAHRQPAKHALDAEVDRGGADAGNGCYFLRCGPA